MLGVSSCILIYAFALCACLPAAPQHAAETPSSTRSASATTNRGSGARCRALLVGVCEYPKIAATKTADEYKHIRLRGPGNDVERMRAALTSLLDLAPADTIILRNGVAPPSAPPSAPPTRTNLLAALDELAKHAAPGDLTVIHLAGHGSQQPDTNGDEADGYDEVFCCEDAMRIRKEDTSIPGAITDDEIGDKIAVIRSRVWLIVDSCCAGTMLRGGDREVRWRYLDPAFLGVEHRKLETHRASPSGETRLYDRDREGVVAMYACGPFDGAREGPFPDPKSADHHGYFTYLLTSQLAASGGNCTFGELHQGVLARFAALGTPSPHPTAEGTLERTIFGDRARGPRLLLQSASDGSLLVNGGALHELETGDMLAVFAPGRRGDRNAILGCVEVRTVELLRSKVAAVERDGRKLATPLAETHASLPVELLECRPPKDVIPLALLDAKGNELSVFPRAFAHLGNAEHSNLRNFVRLTARGQARWLLRFDAAGDRGVLEPSLESGNPRFVVDPESLFGKLAWIQRTETLLRLARHRGSAGLPEGLDAQLLLVDSGKPRPLRPGERVLPGALVRVEVNNRTNRAWCVWALGLNQDYTVTTVAELEVTLHERTNRSKDIPFNDKTVGHEGVLFIATPLGSARLEFLTREPRDELNRGGGTGELLDELAFAGGDPARARGLERGKTKIEGMQLSSYEVSWGEPRFASGGVAGGVEFSAPSPARSRAVDASATTSSSVPPDTWPTGPLIVWRRSDSQRAFVLLSGTKDQLDTLLIDVDQDSELPAGDLEKLRTALASRDPQLDVEIAIRVTSAGIVVAYDTDGDRAFDRVHVDTDRNGFADLEYVLAEPGRWRIQPLESVTPWLQVAATHGSNSINDRCHLTRNALAALLAH